MKSEEFNDLILNNFPDITKDAKLDYICGICFSSADELRIMKFCGLDYEFNSDKSYQYIFNHMINNKHMYEWWCL